jgi:hypothetical protein
MRLPAAYLAFAMFCTIAIQNSASLFAPSWRLAMSNVLPYHPAVRTERLYGTLGPNRQRRMPLKTNPVWGGLTASGIDRVLRALPYRTQSPGQRQQDIVPVGRQGIAGRYLCQLPPAPRRLAEVLRPCRMNILTLRLFACTVNDACLSKLFLTHRRDVDLPDSETKVD